MMKYWSRPGSVQSAVWSAAWRRAGRGRTAGSKEAEHDVTSLKQQALTQLRDQSAESLVQETGKLLKSDRYARERSAMPQRFVEQLEQMLELTESDTAKLRWGDSLSAKLWYTETLDEALLKRIERLLSQKNRRKIQAGNCCRPQPYRRPAPEAGGHGLRREPGIHAAARGGGAGRRRLPQGRDHRLFPEALFLRPPPAPAASRPAWWKAWPTAYAI